MIFQYSLRHRGSTVSLIRLTAPQSRHFSTRCVSTMRNPATPGFLLDLLSKGSQITFVFVTHLSMSLIQPVTSEYHFMHLTDPPPLAFPLLYTHKSSHWPGCFLMASSAIESVWGQSVQSDSVLRDPVGGEQ